LKPSGGGTDAEDLLSETLSINPNAWAADFFAAESLEDRTDAATDVSLDGAIVRGRAGKRPMPPMQADSGFVPRECEGLQY
jgi:hypothetical protein